MLRGQRPLLFGQPGSVIQAGAIAMVSVRDENCLLAHQSPHVLDRRGRHDRPDPIFDPVQRPEQKRIRAGLAFDASRYDIPLILEHAEDRAQIAARRLRQT